MDLKPTLNGFVVYVLGLHAELLSSPWLPATHPSDNISVKLVSYINLHFQNCLRPNVTQMPGVSVEENVLTSTLWNHGCAGCVPAKLDVIWVNGNSGPCWLCSEEYFEELSGVQRAGLLLRRLAAHLTASWGTVSPRLRWLRHVSSQERPARARSPVLCFVPRGPNGLHPNLGPPASFWSWCCFRWLFGVLHWFYWSSCLLQRWFKMIFVQWVILRYGLS